MDFNLFVRHLQNLFVERFFLLFCLSFFKVLNSKLELRAFLHLSFEILQSPYVFYVLNHLSNVFCQFLYLKLIVALSFIFI